MPYLRTAILTTLALSAFAANSILCCMALGERSIDAASFSSVRLIAGAAALLAITAVTRRKSTVTRKTTDSKDRRSGWISALLLFLYAVPFSFAYLELTASTGALILFAAVQLTMTGWGLRTGERTGPRAAFGCAAACAGLVYLVGPKLATPSAGGFALMAIAGISWGAYSLRGRGSTDPLGATGPRHRVPVPEDHWRRRWRRGCRRGGACAR